MVKQNPHSGQKLNRQAFDRIRALAKTDLSGAISEARAAFKSHSKNKHLRALFADLLVRNKNLNEAEQLLSRTEQLDQYGWNIRSRILSRQGKVPEAIAALKACIKMGPRNPDFYSRDLAALEHKRGDLKKSEEILRGQLGKTPDDKACQLNLAYILVETNRQEEAILLLKKITSVQRQEKRAPIVRKAHMLLAKVYKRQGNIRAAQRQLSKAGIGRQTSRRKKSRAPLSSEERAIRERAFTRLAKMHAETGKPGSIRSLIHNAEASDAGKFTKILNALHLRELGKIEEAKGLLASYIQQNAKDHFAIMTLGDMEIKGDNKTAAESLYRRTLKDGFIYSPALLRLAYLAADRNCFDEAFTHIEQVKSIGDQPAAASVSEAQCYVKQGDLKSAVSTCLSEVQKRPRNDLIRIVGAEASRVQENFELAHELIIPALSALPSYQALHVVVLLAQYGYRRDHALNLLGIAEAAKVLDSRKLVALRRIANHRPRFKPAFNREVGKFARSKIFRPDSLIPKPINQTAVNVWIPKKDEFIIWES